MSAAAAPLAAPCTGASLVDGDLVMTTRDFRAIAMMVHEDAGIALHDSKATLVYSRLAKRLRGLGLPSFAAYCALVAGPQGAEERDHMLAALTTNVTRFFREPHHFEHLRRSVLPPLITRARQGGAIRIWSSACSSGQEPYSIAMTLLSLMPDAANHDVRILATDIDPHMVQAGQQGLYPIAACTPVPPELHRRWLHPAPGAPDMLHVADELRAVVQFRRLNLIGQWPFRRTFQAIFCRNVMIYFDQPTQSAVWSRMVPLLDPGGVLYIGHSERIAGPASLHLHSDGVTTYRRLDQARA